MCEWYTYVGTYHESNHNTHYDLCWYGVSSAVKHLAVREPYYYRSSCISSKSVYHYKSSYHWFCWCLCCPFVLPCLLPLMETYILPMTMKIKNNRVAICTLSVISNQNMVIISAFSSLCIRKFVVTIEASGETNSNDHRSFKWIFFLIWLPWSSRQLG